VYMPEKKSSSARGGPPRPSRPQTSASGRTIVPGGSRPDGGSEKGVSYRPTAKR
jgi:hypothetical protein